jgi:hypothetical protein
MTDFLETHPYNTKTESHIHIGDAPVQNVPLVILRTRKQGARPLQPAMARAGSRG